MIDILAIGLGPANLALAAAVAEHQEQFPGERLSARFLELETTFRWHPAMQTSGAKIQTSFLKDLATLRNPRSPYSFVNFLFEHGRLVDFANLYSYQPSRVEFEQYFQWAANRLSPLVQYGVEVLELCPVAGARHTVDAIDVRAVSNGRSLEWRTGNVVLGVGKQPRCPPGVKRFSERVVHSSSFEHALNRSFTDHSRPFRFAVVGGGQSAGEVTAHLFEMFPEATVSVFSRGFLFRAVDANPFVNDLYTDAGTQAFSRLPGESRARLLSDLKNTNYGVVDSDILARLAHAVYEDRLRGKGRLRLHSYSDVFAVGEALGMATLACTNLATDETREERFDCVVLATGYEAATARNLLAPLRPYFEKSDGALVRVDGSSRIRAVPEFRPGIFLQGCSESQLGFTESTLANIACMAGRVLKSALSPTSDSSWRREGGRGHVEASLGAE